MLAPSPASSVNLASPKSRIFSRPSGVRKRFSGLMSRCAMPFACAAASPAASCLPMSTALEGGSAPSERLAQRRSLEQLRDDVRLIVVGADVVHGEDVGVVQDRGRTGFLLEAAQSNGIAGPQRRQHLDRDIAVEPRIARPVDVPHASGAEGREDLVRTEAASGHNTHEGLA